MTFEKNASCEPLDGAIVYLCRPEWAHDQILCDRYYALLDLEERRRHARFHFAADKHNFLVSHALVRVALSRHAEIPPDAWRFRKNDYGRPEIDPQAELPQLRFNLSHTNGLVACVVSEGFDAGIDLENRGAKIDVLSLADRICSPDEMLALNSLPDGARRTRFLAIWTLKEAYAKARGLGLSLPFHLFTFEISGKSIRGRFGPEMAEDPKEWKFVLFKPTPEHFLAIAARAPGRSNAKVSPKWLLPLGEIDPAPPIPGIEADSRGDLSYAEGQVLSSFRSLTPASSMASRFLARVPSGYRE